ncbi:MAG: metallo-mystery pair system four-Cys motif protein [Nannocystis sp.]|nr:MbnP family copper-binding protein [Nannocystis sp.]MBA3548918.1 metallo-mystery pair system four-Cys motif protein [Nannocystis sp.]
MSRLLVPLVCAAALAACDSDSDREVALRFAPVVGDQPFACGEDFDGIGSGASTVTPLDFRMYVHEVALLRSSGERVPVAIRDDGQWQSEGLVLLDFEDGSGACMTGSPATNFEVRGNVPDHGDYVGVEFIVGVPHEQNHLDGAIAPAPLNAQGMWWTWQGGYKYVRLDMRPSTQSEFFYHLGATNCDGSVQDGFECAYANLPSVRIDGFDPGRDTIVVDAAKILAGVDVDHVPDGVKDTLPGCMAFPGDPECPAMMAPLGLRFEDNAPAGVQTVFSARARGGE